ncbi:MAG: tripartite tricarboxylate transporter TctB family protein [Albidovulum sp.]|nr:tripartite tricarboxylate transporter TctB family protein [Albidovulum sp.]MDE0307246.1 tripartite tricarboxylate transporter TctB family protein [Albidovulum sp.]
MSAKLRRKLDIAVSGLLLLVALSLFAVTFTDQFDVPTFGGDVGPAFAPRGFLIVWMVLAATATIQALRGEAEEFSGMNFGKFASVAIIACAMSYGMTIIGFVFSTIPGFFLFCWVFGYRKPLILAVLSVGGPLGIWALFTYVFELLLPRSPWFHMI